MTIIIGLTGYAQHGKDSVGARLVERHGYTRFAFADILKSMARTLDPIIHTGPRGDEIRLDRFVESFGWEEAKQLAEVRRFLQVLGTEAVRDHLGQDTWVNATFNSIASSGVDRAVITDARFPNEFDAVKRHGRLVKVTRYDHVDIETGAMAVWNNGVGTDHPSEQFIATAPADLFIEAESGDMEALLFKADHLAQQLLLKSRLAR